MFLYFNVLLLKLDFHVGGHDAGPLRTALYKLLPLPCIEDDAADGVDRNAFSNFAIFIGVYAHYICAACTVFEDFLLSAALMLTYICVGWQLCWQSLLCGNLMYLFKKF